MIGSELDAAGVRDPRLRDAYRRCRELNAQHGTTFFLATRLLAPSQRPAVHALYGFARQADDILDEFDPNLDTAERGGRLQQLGDSALRPARAGHSACDPALAAVVHTARRYGIAPAAVRRLPRLHADGSDGHRLSRPCRPRPVHVRLGRGHRSAVASRARHRRFPGTRPRPTPPRSERRSSSPTSCATWTRTSCADRVYLPADELAAHGVDRELLTWCHVQPHGPTPGCGARWPSSTTSTRGDLSTTPSGDPTACIRIPGRASQRR